MGNRGGGGRPLYRGQGMAGMTDFKGRARRLDQSDFAKIARQIGVGEPELRAVVEVETRGGGFDAMGRPKMLFEPHVFWRELGEAKRRRAENAGVAYRKWGSSPYPKDSYPRLGIAISIDRPAALRSASWGLGQIMGFNCRMAGYRTADEMVQAFMDDEESHLSAMVEFIEASGLDDDLRRIADLGRKSTAADWAPFARGYNGAGYASHGYHTKLAAAHAKWSHA